MNLYAFKGVRGWHALTVAPTGDNLPADRAPWTSLGRVYDFDKLDRSNLKPDTAAALIEADGYYVTQIEITFEPY